MNIIGGVGAYVLCSGVPLLSTVFFLFAIVSFAVAIINGVPMCMGTVDDDGYNALVLTSNPKAVEAFWVQLCIIAMHRQDRREESV